MAATQKGDADGRNPFAPRKETKVETLPFVGIFREIESNKSVFLRCEMEFAHPRYGHPKGDVCMTLKSWNLTRGSGTCIPTECASIYGQASI